MVMHRINAFKKKDEVQMMEEEQRKKHIWSVYCVPDTIHVL